MSRSVLFGSLGLVALGLMFTGLSLQGAPAKVETRNCCEQQLACCKQADGPAACCVAMERLGCCEKGMACCKENRACCHAVQKCCQSGMECCTVPKACCGAKPAVKTAGVAAEGLEPVFAASKPACCQKVAEVN